MRITDLSTGRSYKYPSAQSSITSNSLRPKLHQINDRSCLVKKVSPAAAPFYAPDRSVQRTMEANQSLVSSRGTSSRFASANHSLSVSIGYGRLVFNASDYASATKPNISTDLALMSQPLPRIIQGTANHDLISIAFTKQSFGENSIETDLKTIPAIMECLNKAYFLSGLNINEPLYLALALTKSLHVNDIAQDSMLLRPEEALHPEVTRNWASQYLAMRFNAIPSNNDQSVKLGFLSKDLSKDLIPGFLSRLELMARNSTLKNVFNLPKAWSLARSQLSSADRLNLLELGAWWRATGFRHFLPKNHKSPFYQEAFLKRHNSNFYWVARTLFTSHRNQQLIDAFGRSEGKKEMITSIVNK